MLFDRRVAIGIGIVALACYPFVLLGALRALQSNSNDVKEWLPDSFEETQQIVWFFKRFGSDEVLAISWAGCTLDDQRLEELAKRLRQPHWSPLAGSEVALFRNVFTGREVLDELTSEPLNLSRRVALRRMKGWLVGSDGEVTCAVAIVSHAGYLDRHAAIEQVRQAAQSCGIRPSDLRLGGPTIDSVTIDVASAHRFIELAAVSVVVSLLIAAVALRSLRLVVCVFLTAHYAWALSLSILYYTGRHMDAILMMLPALVYVLSISGAIHLANYYRDALATGEKDPLRWALSRGWLPCTLACVTTAVGLGSLAVSDLVPIRDFGIYSALSVLAMLLLLLVHWPACVRLLVPVPNREPSLPNVSTGKGGTVWWRFFWLLSTKYYVAVLLTTLIGMPVCAYGISKLRTSAKLEELFQPSSDLIQDYAWLQEKIGPLVPVEVVLRFKAADSGDATEMLARLELVEQLRRRIDGMDDIGGTTAASSFAVAIPPPNRVARRAAVARRLYAERQRFTDLRYLYEDKLQGTELWRISTRVEALRGLDYGQVLNRLNEEVSAFLAENVGDQAVTSEVCGGVPLINMAQEQLLRDLVKSFITAFALIAIVMTVLMKRLGGGLLSMLPNLFPAVVTFGLMGLLAMPVDIGAMMTASVALGIAVDDTLHFLTWFRRRMAQTSDRRDAVEFAFRHCAAPMLQTSIVCGCGLLVFAISPFVPIAKFSWLMAFLLLLAIAGDLILLPALLVSPLGKLFAASGSNRNQQVES